MHLKELILINHMQPQSTFSPKWLSQNAALVKCHMLDADIVLMVSDLTRESVTE